ncbi:MAG: tetratricopeptide repeat protein, partial [Planctomycetota bacterium]
MMDHPSIARILDAGTTEQGQPFFAMELVRGVPLTEYCDQNKLNIRERLEIFQQICDGIQQAHQKGIVHRDLKPSNILVTEFNGKAQPKIIDFGLAKALDTTQKLTDKTMSTGIGQVLGTLKYMSPEQAGLNSLDVDTRSDVYTLGVILYELLTGSTPLDDESLNRQAIMKILELIREKEPPRPSTRLSSIGDSALSISGVRQLEGRELTQILRGDLDWIVMKAIDKDRERRYGSAAGLSDDIQCYLNDAPVSARPPSSAYLLRKFVKRNRALALSVGAIGLTLIVGSVATGYGMIWALDEKEKADRSALAAKQLASEKAALADEKAALAEQKTELADRNQTVVDYFVSAFRSADTNLAGVTHKTTALEVLLKALERIEADTELSRDKLTKATLLEAIAESLKSLGAYKEAMPADEEALRLRTEALGKDASETWSSVSRLADSHVGLGDNTEALRLYRELLSYREENLGKEHVETLDTASNIARCYRALGQLQQAIRTQNEVLKARQKVLGDEHPDTLSSISALGVAYHAAGDLQSARPLLEESLKKRQSVLGEDHPSTLMSMTLLASLHQHAGRINEAIDLQLKTLAKREAKLGRDHPNTVTSVFALASCYSNAGRFAEALPLYQETLESRTRKLGDLHPDTFSAKDFLGDCYIRLGRVKEGLPLVEEAYRLRKAELGESHPETLLSMNHLALRYAEINRRDEAAELYEQALATQEKKLGKNHPETLATMNNLATCLYASKQFDRAIELLREAVDRHEEKLGSDHPHTLSFKNNLASVLAQTGNLKEAIQMHHELHATSVKQLGENHPDTITR